MKLKYNLRKLNIEGFVWLLLVINCCNIVVECLYGCSIKKIFSYGYFENGNYWIFLIGKSYMKFRYIYRYMMNLIFKIVYFFMLIYYVVILRNI